MPPARTFPLAALLFAALAALAAVAAAPRPAVAAAVPHLAIRHRALANGLEVYSVEDHASPTVAIQVWYRVGSKDDPPGRSGFAHLFEHMMFKRTANMPSEMFDRLTEDVGGYNNATTRSDVTLYYEVVPSRYLQTLLWAEADRLATLQVDEAAFGSERDVVKEEYRQRVDASPYGALYFIYLPQSSFRVHPYRRPGIGSLADLDAATLADVQQFHRTFYRPDDAVLVVVGDFQPAQLDGWVDRYFAPIPRPELPLPRVDVKEPPRQQERREVRYRPNVPLPAVAVSFLVPPAASPEAPVARVTEALLSEGTSSRLQQSLVYAQRVASQAFAYTSLDSDAGTFTLVGIAASGKSPDAVEHALEAETDKLRTEPAGAAELAKVKRQLVTQQLEQLETAAGKAEVIGEAAVMQGDAEEANRLVERLEAVQASDVQAYARRWFGAENRLVIDYLADAAQPASETAAAPAGAPQQPPPPGPAAATQLPVPAERTLANGLRVVVVDKPGVPLATARLLVRSGAAADPPAEAGLADLTARLLQRGTQSRSATEIATEVESLGGSLDSGADWDGSSATVSVMVPELAPALGLLADVVEHPAFAPEEVERLRQERVDEVTVSLEQPATLAFLQARREVFGQEPYGHASGGTPQSLSAIRREDLAAFHARAFRPDQAVLVIAGALPTERSFALAEEAFGGWAPPAAAPAATIAAPATGGPTAAAPPAKAPARSAAAPPQPLSVVVVDLPHAGQAAVVVAARTIPRRDPRYFTSRVLNSVFGGGYSSRLNAEVRIQRGLSYGAGSSLEPLRLDGYFAASAQTKNESATEVATVMLDLLAQLGSSAPASDELAPRKAALAGGFGRQLETTEGLVRGLGALLVEDLEPAALATYLPGYEAVTGEQVRAFAAEQLPPDGMRLVVAGDAKVFLDGLRKLFPALRVVAASEVAPPGAAAP